MEQENKAVPRITIKSVHIRRDWSDSAYQATISVSSTYSNEMTINVPEDRVLMLIDAVADIVNDALAVQLGNMREDAQHALDQKRMRELPSPVDAEPADAIDDAERYD